MGDKHFCIEIVLPTKNVCVNIFNVYIPLSLVFAQNCGMHFQLPFYLSVIVDSN